MSESKLAIEGGTPVRESSLPYGCHEIREADIEAIAAAMRDPLLTRGPKVASFEQAVAEKVGARYAVAYTSGTAGLDGAAWAAGLGPGKRHVSPTLTFAATANMGFYHDAQVDLADVARDDWNIDPEAPALRDAPTTVAPVHFAGLPIDMAALAASAPGSVLIEDAAHALGAHRDGVPVGACDHGAMAVFSFHPVKVVTSLEGGVVTTNDEELRDRLLRFRDHGMVRDKSKMTRDDGPWYFEQQDLGRNYRMTDVQAALGLSQLGYLDEFVASRNEHAAWYRDNLPTKWLDLPPAAPDGSLHAYHLFVVQLHLDKLRVDFRKVFEALRAEGLGIQLHYLPVHRQPYHQARVLNADPARFPVAEEYYSRSFSIPIFPGLTPADRQDVVDALVKVCEAYKA